MQAIVENLLKEFPNVLTLRVRMPIVTDLLYPRNFITKIIKYDKVVNIPNSMTVLPELLPMSIEMVRAGVGVCMWLLRGSVAGCKGRWCTSDSRRDAACNVPPDPVAVLVRMPCVCAGQAQADGHHELHQPRRHQPQ